MTTNPAVLSRRSAVELNRAVSVEASKPKLRPWIVFTMTVVVAFFGMIYSRISLDRTAFELEELEDSIAEQETLVLELELEIARLQAPARIDDLVGDLGLGFPDDLVPMQIAAIEPEGLDPELRLAQLDRLLTAQR